jgi:hypothetical protein
MARVSSSTRGLSVADEMLATLPGMVHYISTLAADHLKSAASRVEGTISLEQEARTDRIEWIYKGLNGTQGRTNSPGAN